MHAFTLQDWNTIRAQSGIQTITQGEDGWIDLSPYQDVVFWVDCREVTGTVTIQFQTSPCKEDATFQNMLTGSGVTMTAQSAPQTAKCILSSTTATPVARYVRWQLAGPATGGWDSTFRILLSANSPGM